MNEKKFAKVTLKGSEDICYRYNGSINDLLDEIKKDHGSVIEILHDWDVTYEKYFRGVSNSYVKTLKNSREILEYLREVFVSIPDYYKYMDLYTLYKTNKSLFYKMIKDLAADGTEPVMDYEDCVGETITTNRRSFYQE